MRVKGEYWMAAEEDTQTEDVQIIDPPVHTSSILP